MKSYTQEQINKAKARVLEIKGFYKHLITYLVINLFVIFVNAIFVIPNVQNINPPHFINWINANIIFCAGVWGLAVGIHALFVFGKIKTILSNWEEKKIKEFLDKE